MARTWTVTKRDRRQAQQLVGFFLIASESQSGDRVVATINPWDSDNSGDHELYGLPDGIPFDTVWDLGRIEPRQAKVPGGTTALLRELIRLADAEDKWVVASVQTGSTANDKATARLLSKAGFTAPHAEYPYAMHRTPGAASCLHP